MWYRVFADVTVAIHFAYVTFVLVGLLVTLVGGCFGWEWVKNRWFRGIHLLMILIVVIEAWLGITCPLTILERELRSAAGQESYRGDFIASHLHEAMFFQADPWFFTAAYTCFGALVIAVLYFVPPAWRRRPSSTQASA